MGCGSFGDASNVRPPSPEGTPFGHQETAVDNVAGEAQARWHSVTVAWIDKLTKPFLEVNAMAAHVRRKPAL